MLQVAGEIHAGEAADAMREVARRQRGSIGVYWLRMLSFPAVGGLVGYGLAFLLSFVIDSSALFAAPVIGFVIGYVIWSQRAKRFVLKRFRREMATRNLQLRYPTSFTVDDEGLHCISGPVSSSAEWSAVTDLFLEQGYWVFMVQMSPWVCPRRLFTTPADERAFITGALDRSERDEDGRLALNPV